MSDILEDAPKRELSYVSERDKNLASFENWTEPDQLDYIENLLLRMNHYQHGKINEILTPMLQRDFITLLQKKGLDHIAESILSYLDVKSLCAAKIVCKEWNRVISDAKLWKKLIQRKGMEKKGLADRRKWSCHLFKPVASRGQFLLKKSTKDEIESS